MKLHCPRCEKKLSIPDKFAGKAIRCPACNRAFNVPKPQAALSGPGGPAVDLENLAALERGSSQMGEEELAGAQLHSKARPKAKPGERICPQCEKVTPSQDIYAEILCSHCWTPIPGVSVGDGYDTGDTKLVGYKGSVGQSSVSFYNGLATAMGYPVQAIGSLLVAVLVAISIILLPVALMTAVAQATEQSAAGSAAGVKDADLSGVQVMLRGVFLAEVLFFSAVGVHALLDVIRTTAVGEEKPPTLSWHPSQWGKSIVGYVALLVYYVVMTYVVLFIANGGQVTIPYSIEEAQTMFSNPNVIVGMVFISFVIPMNLMGLALGEIGQALNPVNVLKSIGKTHIHYVFLVIMLCVYGTICGAAFFGILQWFLPQVDAMATGAGEGKVGTVALGLLAWGLVMGFTFYSMYALGRLHGLFARTYRKHLLFGEM